jgi:hypothetical protein
MLSVEEKLHNLMLATLEENIRLNQRLFAAEENEIRRKFIQDLLAVLNAKLLKEKSETSPLS